MLPHPIRRLSAAFAALAALALSASALAFTPPPFPRLAGIEVAGQANYNSVSYQDQLAELSVVILKYWPGMDPGGESMNSIVRALKAKNPDMLVFLYTDIDGLTPSGSGAMSPLSDKLTAMHWWLAGSTATSLVASFYGHGELTINNTPYTSKDASGNDAIDWITRWYVSNYYEPNQDIDGLFVDNTFVAPRVAGDWYNNGVVLQPSSAKAAAALQAGYERWFQLTRQLMPGKYQIGNLGSWASAGTMAMPAGYRDMANGGALQALIGESWSPESWAGWAKMMSEYDMTLQAVSAPQLVIFNQMGNPTDYQGFRYGFASCLMNDGYYSFTPYSGYYGVQWFDEYNHSLGAAVGAPPTGPWQKGVWRRDFTNGIALVNPKGNGPQTVTLGGTFVKIKGTQDPAVNNGQTVTQVTLQNRDGLILLRLSPLKQPAAPTSVSAGTD